MIYFIILLLFMAALFLPIAFIRFKLKKPESLNLVSINSEKIPSDALAFLNQTSKDLADKGFISTADLTESQPELRDPWFIRYLVNQNDGSFAFAMCRLKNSGRSSGFKDAHLEFHTCFSEPQKKLYQLIFTGYIAEGKNSGQVKKKLSALLKLDISKMERFISGKPVPTKANLTLTQAEALKKAIEKTGAICRIKAVKKNSEIKGLFSTNSKLFLKNSSDKKIIQKPSIKKAKELYALHQNEVKKLKNSMKTIFPEKNKEAIYLSEIIAKNIKNQTKAGYFYLDKALKTYRPTWKGAFFILREKLFYERKF